MTDWKLIHQSIDVTGDTLSDLCEQYHLVLSGRSKGEEWERDTLTYMNPDQTTKMIATPYWDAANGATYSLAVYTHDL